MALAFVRPAVDRTFRLASPVPDGTTVARAANELRDVTRRETIATGPLKVEFRPMAFAHNAEAAERGFHSFFGLSARAKSTTVFDATDARRVHPSREGARRSPERQTARPAGRLARGERQRSGPGARVGGWGPE